MEVGPLVTTVEVEAMTEVEVEAELAATAEDQGMESDMESMIGLGLSLADIERLWSRVPGIDMARVHAIGERLVSMDRLPLTRQASVGLELLRHQQPPASPGATALEDSLVASLTNELASPPDHLCDPIMFTLMVEPQILSSGHILDKKTIFDANGRPRFEKCPMTRESLKADAYPVLGLKAQLTEYRQKKLDQILEALDAGGSRSTAHAATLLEMAKGLFDGLDEACKGGRGSRYLRHLTAATDDPAQAPKLLAELAAGGGKDDLLREAYERKVAALQHEVTRLWAEANGAVRASALSIVSKAMAALRDAFADPDKDDGTIAVPGLPARRFRGGEEAPRTAREKAAIARVKERDMRLADWVAALDVLLRGHTCGDAEMMTKELAK